MRIGSCWIDIQIPGVRSLKEKRRVVKSIKEKLTNSFHVAVAEVGALDKWQRTEIGIACVGNDIKVLHHVMSSILNKLNHDPSIHIIDHHIEIL